MKERRRDNRAAFGLAKLVEILNAEVLSGAELLSKTNVSGCFATNLMSDVLAYSKPGMLLLTALSTVQSIHAADVAELRGVIFVSNKEPEKSVLDLATRRSIPLARTKHSLTAASGILAKAGLETNLK
jgi:predicted transcriptional regulator